MNDVIVHRSMYGGPERFREHDLILSLSEEHVGKVVEDFHLHDEYKRYEDYEEDGGIFLKIFDIIDEHRFIGAFWDSSENMWELGEDTWDIEKDALECMYWRPVRHCHRLNLLVKTGETDTTTEEYYKYIYYNAPRSLRKLYHQLVKEFDNTQYGTGARDELSADVSMLGHMLGYESWFEDDYIEEVITHPNFIAQYPKAVDYPVWREFHQELGRRFDITRARPRSG